MSTHLFYVPFTGLGLRGGYRGDAWLKNRIEIFKRFTLTSLLNQDSQDYILWVSWRPQDKDNSIVAELKESLSNIRGLQFVFTFGGICFWDDKFENDTLLERLKATLPDLQDYITGSTVLMTIQPSDDMYTSEVVSLMKEWPVPTADVIGFSKGYIMNYGTKEIAEYNPTTSPPFYTIKFQTETFLDPIKHYQFTGPYKSHEYVGQFMSYTLLDSRSFVVGTHGENISTTYQHPYKGRVLSDGERDAILLRTGTFFVDPIVIKKRFRLLARKILNLLPIERQLRELYHSLPVKYQKI